MATSRLENMSKLFRVKYGQLVLLYLIIWMGLGIMVVQHQGLSGTAIMILWVVLGVVFLEVLTRLALRVGIGPEYFYWLYGYCLVDDERYGFRFRNSLSIPDIEFRVFDRLAFPEGVRPSLDLNENRAQRLKFSTNSRGFRGEEFDPKVKNRKLRIFCVGGSTTACGFCSDSDTWPKKLEYYLGEHGVSAEVINAGTIGWSSYQEYLLVKEEVMSYCPDLLLLHQGWNEEFLYSSLSLGKDWKPGMTRNVREAYSLYTAPSALLSSTRSISFSLLVQHYYRNWLFAANMSFENPARWAVLHHPDYLRAWFDNLVLIAQMANEENILTYTLDYPGLTNITDLPQDRESYVNNSRLTHRYADYQAVSKKRISRTLELADELISCVRVNKAFDDISGSERLSLFEDEIHLSARGNDLFAKTLAGTLNEEANFMKLTDGIERENQLLPSYSKISAIRSQVGVNPSYLSRLIDKNLFSARQETGGIRGVARKGTSFDIPQTRYTTW
jgi:hypothetical protein